MNSETNTAISGKTVYEGSVIVRATTRAGNNPHLKGHIHEILVQDSKNLSNLFNGQTTQLTKSTTANAVDLVTMKAGKVVERLQVKDTISQSGIDKLVGQVTKGKYRTTQLVGTEETADLVNSALQKAGLQKRMVSSGVSSKTTTQLAQRAGATGSGSVGSAIGNAARSGGSIAAVVGASIEVVKGISDLVDGSREPIEVVGSVVKAGAKGYMTGASAGAAATASGALVATGLAAVGAGAAVTTVAVFAAPVVAAVGVGYAASKVFDWIFD